MKNEDVEMHPAGMVKHTQNGCNWAVTPGISDCPFCLERSGFMQDFGKKLLFIDWGKAAWTFIGHPGNVMQGKGHSC